MNQRGGADRDTDNDATWDSDKGGTNRYEDDDGIWDRYVTPSRNLERCGGVGQGVSLDPADNPGALFLCNALLKNRSVTLDVINARRYYSAMIRSFKCKEAEKVFNRSVSKKLPHAMQNVALRKLWLLDAATDISDLRVPPNNRLEGLKGKRKGQYSIRINQQWRVCFRWHAGNAHEVEIVDYH